MKKTLLLCTMTLISIVPAIANINKCVYYDSGATVEMDSTADTKADWSGTLTNPDGTTVRIEGVVACSKMSGSDGDARDTLTTATTDDSTAHKYCWCKMVRPFVSWWVFVNASTSAPKCARYCSHHCALNIRDEAVVRNALFSNPLTVSVK